MLEDFYTSNNHAHLLLYGGAGTGKTLIVSAISSSVATYRFVTGSRFQNPDLLKSSLLSLEEFDTASLPSNQYKQLLDLKSHMKIDFKNLNPENVTEGVPCMITTNDDVFTVLRQQKKVNQASVDAALRRLYLVPVKAGPFEKLHGRVPKGSPLFKLLLEHDHKFDQEYNKLQRIFNLIVAFALYQQDVRGFYFDSRIHPYFQGLAKDFARTTFGTFYLSNKDSIDGIVAEAEHSMTLSDQDDSSYLVKISTCVGQFQQLLYDFIGSMSVNNSEIDSTVLKDKTVPWPAKAYYYLSSYRFIVRVMHQIENYEGQLNEEVRGFINNPNMQLYRITDTALNNSDNSQYEPYKDLQDPLDTDQEEQDPFASPVPPHNTEGEMLPPLGVIRREISVLDLDNADIKSVFSGLSGKRSMSERYGCDNDEFKIREESYVQQEFDKEGDYYQDQQDNFQ